MSKRRYVKKNKDYWSGRSGGTLDKTPQISADEDSFEAFSIGKSYSELGQASSRGSARTSRKATPMDPNGRFKALRETGSPFLESGDNITISDAIDLCRVAYFNIAAFANSIDIMSEFANVESYMEGGTAKSRKFFTSWLEKINIESLKQQYFREYFRGGNILIYRIEGDLNVDGVRTLAKMSDTTIKATKLPVKYVMLDACGIIANNGLVFDKSSYYQILSEFQLKKLQNPATEEDLLILKSLPKEAQRDIKNGNFKKDGLHVQLDPKKVLISFYKKQDYEAFSVPFGYRVLDDINSKLELKKMDSAIARSVENVILLVTMGESARDGGAGVNQKNVEAVRALFESDSVGRVLVSDYTTKGEFIIPDLKKVMGSDKYEVLNQDIKDGLQNIIVGKENYGSTQMKAQMFLERLREARHSLLCDIMQTEIKRLAKNMGFKKTPVLKLKDMDLSDENVMLRVVTRLIELSVFTPEQGMEVIRTGEFPEPTDIRKGHEKFIKDKREGFYNPLVGGVPMWTNQDGNAQEVKMAKLNNTLAIKAAKEAPKPIASPVAPPAGGRDQTKPTGQKAGGRPLGSGASKKSKAIASVEDFNNTVGSVRQLEEFIVSESKTKYETKNLNDDQKNACLNLCVGIVESRAKNEWEDTAKACIEDPLNIMKLNIMDEINEFSGEHSIPSYSAALLYHSLKK